MVLENIQYWDAVPAYAATTNDIGHAIGLSDANLVTIVVRVLQLVLGYAPLVAVAFLILGGFIWMTSIGNEERLEKAKKTISGAIIGLIIIILAWAVVSFVAKTTINVSNTTNSADASAPQ